MEKSRVGQSACQRDSGGSIKPEEGTLKLPPLVPPDRGDQRDVLVKKGGKPFSAGTRL